MEFRDIYNENGEIVRHRIPKGANLGDGEYIRMVEAWLVDDSGRILVQRRSFSCLIYPGYWTLTTGHAFLFGDPGQKRLDRRHILIRVDPDISECLSVRNQFRFFLYFFAFKMLFTC